MTHRLLSFLLLLVVATCAPLTPAPASTVTAPAPAAILPLPLPAVVVTSPASVAADIVTAPAGATVRLGPGSYPAIYLRGASARTQPLTIDGSDPAAIVAGFRCDGCANLTIAGMTLAGGGIVLQGGHDLVVRQVLSTAPPRAAVALGQVTGFRIEFVEVVDAGSDGIDVAGSNHGDIGNITCSGSHPTPGAHPDCVQLYSKGAPYSPLPTTDVVVHDSVATGDTQGFGMEGNNLPAARITFANLTVMTRFSLGIHQDSNGGCTGCTLSGSHVLAMRGSTRIVQISADRSAVVSGSSGNSPRP